jgi:hypothetical protein
MPRHQLVMMARAWTRGARSSLKNRFLAALR